LQKQNQKNDNQYPAKKDESLKLGLVDSKQQPQPEEQKTRLRRLANLGKNVVLRRRNSQQDVAPKTNHNSGDKNPAEDDDTPDPQETLLALHEACSNKSADLTVIQYLVARHPQGAAAMKDGNLPLHTAVTFRAPAKVIEYLLEAYPQATGVRNKRFKLPIHIACECKASLEVIKLLVKADPESLEVADYEVSTVQFQKVWIVHAGKFSMEAKTGLPLHYACKYLASLHVIHHLITEYPGTYVGVVRSVVGWIRLQEGAVALTPLLSILGAFNRCGPNQKQGRMAARPFQLRSRSATQDHSVSHDGVS
jgi:Ankyrin repeats (3 copies)